MTFFEWFEIWLDDSIKTMQSGAKPLNGYAQFIADEQSEELCHMQIIKLSDKVTMEIVMVYCDGTNFHVFGQNPFSGGQIAISFTNQDEFLHYIEDLKQIVCSRNIAFEIISDEMSANPIRNEGCAEEGNILSLFSPSGREDMFIEQNPCVRCERWHYFSDEYDENFFKILCDTQGMRIVITTVWPHLEDIYWQAENVGELKELLECLNDELQSGDYELVLHEELEYPFEKALEQAMQTFEMFKAQQKQMDDNE